MSDQNSGGLNDRSSRGMKQQGKIPMGGQRFPGETTSELSLLERRQSQCGKS